MKTCFSEEKLIAPLSNRIPPVSLSTNPPISEQFFHDPLLCPNFENKTPLLKLCICWGEGNCVFADDTSPFSVIFDKDLSAKN